MDQSSTHEFVEKLHERQEKDRKNREKNGEDGPSKVLPNKRH
ncbi:DUF4023 domain-containing protein [Neobacillus mesonae]|nr:DUF4023 domain-containing protein [Neobacillus mesonae]MCM3567091.1 DUF4023 domain-containing protein [Neobacillus mesonae]